MRGLDDFLDLVIVDNGPTTAAMVRYLFWEKGISEKEFNKLSLPYIQEIINTHAWVKKEEEKAYNKANKKR